MEKIRKKLQNFMQGRNGMDELVQMGLVVSCICCVIAVFSDISLIYAVAWASAVCSLYRFFSKNIRDRQEENYRFVHAVTINKMKYEQRKEYKIFKCKKCGRNIRIPRGKGKIEVTCPLCGNKTRHKT